MPSHRSDRPESAATARTAASLALDEILAAFDPMERMAGVAELSERATQDQALWSALEAEALGTGRLRRRAIATVALGHDGSRVLARARDKDLVHAVMKRLVDGWYAEALRVDGPARAMRKEFIDHEVLLQVEAIEALTEDDDRPPAGIVAFLAWLADAAPSALVRREAEAVVAEQEHRDWRHEATAAVHAANLEQAARAYELLAREDPSRPHTLARGLGLLAVGDDDEALELLEAFGRDHPRHPLAARVAATCAWLRQRLKAPAGDENPLLLPLPFLVEDPVGDLLEGGADDRLDGLVQRALWGLGLVVMGERLAELEWDARAWADVVAQIARRLSALDGKPLVRDRRDRVDARAALLIEGLRLDEGPTDWFEELRADLDDALAEAAAADEAEDEPLPAWAEAVAEEFLAHDPRAAGAPDVRLFIQGLLRSLASARATPERVDAIDLCQALADFAAVMGLEAGAEDPAANVAPGVEWGLSLAAFLQKRHGAALDVARLESLREELTELLGRLAQANAAAIREVAAAQDDATVAELEGIFVVEQVKAGRVWARPTEATRTLTITTSGGLDDWLRPGDVLLGSLGRARSGRYVVTSVERVMALPAAVVADVRP